jgi:biotin carboxylase
MSSSRRVLLAYPTAWDRPQLEACRDAWAGRTEPLFGRPTDEGSTWDEDALAWVDRIERAHRGAAGAALGGPLAGVASSSDYPGAIVASELARRLGLPGAAPEALIRAGHKWYSRLAQQRVMPDATPRFALLDPARPDEAPAAVAEASIDFPCWVKPVKGAFSVRSRRVRDADDLAAFLAEPATARFLDTWVPLFDRLLHGLTRLEVDGRHFLAEELLGGSQVTVEGCVQQGRVTIFGVVDSIVDARTGSFTRFEYPSSLPGSVQQRMGDVTARAVAGLGLDDVLFNVEMFWDETRERLSIIEINPRIAGQFGDLYLKVDGTSSYEHLLAVAAGQPVRAPRRGAGRFACAASVPLRVFEPVRVAAAPRARDLEQLSVAHPDTLVWIEARPGQELADFTSFQDGSSHRYAVVNLGAESRDALEAKLAEVEERLGFRFERLASPAGARTVSPVTGATVRAPGTGPA